VSCAQLARTPGLGRCAPGADTAVIPLEFGGGFGEQTRVDKRIWPPSELSPAQVAALPVHAIIVGTNGTTAAMETARTVLENTYPSQYPPDTVSSRGPDKSLLLTRYKQLANVVILVSIPIAGCSLAVAAVAGIAERRRPFSLLRLTGVPMAMLRRVVALETVVPLVLTAIVSIGVGLVAADLFLRAQLDETLVAPGAQYYVIVGIGLIAALAILASTMPLLARVTGPEASRTD
jgi:predicted lysophospholipase L1 biosynthesis ABC-type transport system permease subunit